MTHRPETNRPDGGIYVPLGLTRTAERRPPSPLWALTLPALVLIAGLLCMVAVRMAQ